MLGAASSQPDPDAVMVAMQMLKELVASDWIKDARRVISAAATVVQAVEEHVIEKNCGVSPSLW